MISALLGELGQTFLLWLITDHREDVTGIPIATVPGNNVECSNWKMPPLQLAQGQECIKLTEAVVDGREKPRVEIRSQ